jgi:hypothetical protein
MASGKGLHVINEKRCDIRMLKMNVIVVTDMLLETCMVQIGLKDEDVPFFKDIANPVFLNMELSAFDQVQDILIRISFEMDPGAFIGNEPH